MKNPLTLTAALLGLLPLQPLRLQAESPELFKTKEMSSASLAEAANYYIGLGEERAIGELKKLEEDFSTSTMKKDINRNERIGWVCRIVFTGSPGKPLRPPMYGGLALPWLTMPLERWPLYPVAESNDVFFVLSEGYILSGMAERASDYIDYCSKAGTFRKAKLRIPSQDEAVKAFHSLKTDKRWKMIKWKDEGPGTQFTTSEYLVLRAIEKQATSIPKK